MVSIEQENYLHEVKHDGTNWHAPNADERLEQIRLEIFDQEFAGANTNNKPSTSPSFLWEDHALNDAFDLAHAVLLVGEEFSLARQRYINNIKALRTYCSLDFLRKLTVEELRRLHEALIVLENAVEEGRLSLSDITESTRSLAHRLLSKQVVKEQWSERDPAKKEKSIDFLLRVWGDAIRERTLKRSELADFDEQLYSSVNTYYSRLNKQLETNPDHQLKIPEWVLEWLTESSVASSEEVDKELQTLGISHPSDVYRKNLGVTQKEKLRLYGAAKRRFG